MNENKIRPGLRTSEFWLAFIVTFAGAVAAVYAEAQWAQVAGLLSSALTAAGYAFARAKVKLVEASGNVALAAVTAERDARASVSMNIINRDGAR